MLFLPDSRRFFVLISDQGSADFPILRDLLSIFTQNAKTVSKIPILIRISPIVFSPPIISWIQVNIAMKFHFRHEFPHRPRQFSFLDHILLSQHSH